MITNIRHYGISVKDEVKALHLYEDLLGFKIVKKDKEIENFVYKVLKIKHVTYIKLEKDGQLIELYIMPRDRERGKWNHIALTVDNIDNLYKELSDEKIIFISEPTIDPSGTHKLCFCRDYDGNLIELVQELKEKTHTNPVSSDKIKATRKKIKAPTKKYEARNIKKTTNKIRLNPNPFNKKPEKEIPVEAFDKEYKDADE